MASIVSRPNRHRWVQFVDTNGKRQTLRLGKVTKKNAEEVARRVEVLIDDCIKASSDAQWRAIIALTRYGGFPVAMKHDAMARKEVFEAAALNPSGTMPEDASSAAEKTEAKPEAAGNRREWSR